MQTSFMIACLNENVELAIVLRELGASVEVLDANGEFRIKFTLIKKRKEEEKRNSKLK